MELPEIDLIVFDAKEIKDKNTITRPSTRIRPVTSQKLLREGSLSTIYMKKTTISRPQSGFLPLRPLTPGHTHKIKNLTKNFALYK